MLDPNTYQVFLDGDSVAFTASEFRILYKLVVNQGNVVTHQSLENSLHRIRTNEYADGNSLVKKYIQRLR